MCVQMHGDASFTGQGVVMESLGLSEAYLNLFKVCEGSYQAAGRQLASFYERWKCPSCGEVSNYSPPFPGLIH